MGVGTLIASASAFVAIVALLAVVDSALYCADPIIKNNVPECPSPLNYNSTLSKCCGNQPIYAGQRPESGTGTGGSRRRRRGRGRRRYCGPYLLVNGQPDCPSTHPYDERKDKCCGRRPIDGYSRDDRRRSSRTNSGCVDKNVPGRPSDCPANAGKCNDPLWRDLMTDQCPKTCNRCGQTSNYRANTLTPGAITPTGFGMGVGVGGVGVGGVGVGARPGGGCVDGVGPSGVSECSQNAALCNHPSYSAFMRTECPATCGVCGGTGTGVSRTNTNQTTGRRRRGGRRGGRRSRGGRRRQRDDTGRRGRRRGGRRRSRGRRSRRRRN